MVTMLIVSVPTARATAMVPAVADAPSIVGAWALDKERSDRTPASAEGGRGGPGSRSRPGGGRGGRGGRGGGGLGGGVGRGGERSNAESMERMRDARRAILEAPDRITIVQTDSTVIVTTGDGRTTRLAIDGTKVKDESTGITRRTRWEAGQLITEITGAGPGKIVESYDRAPDAADLRVTLTFEDGEARPPVHRVYSRID
jgi:hypothetical protein